MAEEKKATQQTTEPKGVRMPAWHATAIESFLEDEKNFAAFRGNIFELLSIRLFAEDKSSEQWQEYAKQWLKKTYKSSFSNKGVCESFAALALHTLQSAEKTINAPGVFLENIEAQAQETLTGTRNVFNIRAREIFNKLCEEYKTRHDTLSFSDAKVRAFHPIIDGINRKLVYVTNQNDMKYGFVALGIVIAAALAMLLLPGGFSRNALLFLLGILCFYVALGTTDVAPKMMRKQGKIALENTYRKLADSLENALVIILEKRTSANKKEVVFVVTTGPTSADDVVAASPSDPKGTHAYLRSRGITSGQLAEWKKERSAPASTPQADEASAGDTKKELHYDNEIHLENNDFALLDLTAMNNCPREMEQHVQDTFAKKLSEHTGIVKLDKPENRHYHKMKLQGNTKDCVYATWIIKNTDGTRTLVFNDYSEHSHNKKRHVLPPPQEISPEQWLAHLAKQQKAAEGNMAAASAIEQEIELPSIRGSG